MSEPTKAAVFNQVDPSAGQQVVPDQVDASQVTEPKAAQPEYITLQDAQRLFKDAEENAFRRTQGLVDKADHRMTKKVQDNLASVQGMLDALKAQGIDVPADKAQALKNEAIEKAYTDVKTESTPVSPQEPAQAPVQEDGQVDPVTAIAWKMMQDSGVVIDETNPLLDRSSEMAFLNSVQAAITASVASGTAQQPSTEPPQAARTPTSAGMIGSHVVPNYGDMSMDELWAEGNK